MYLILFILHNPDYVEELLTAWERIGVTGVTVLFSTGLGRLRQRKGIRDDLPLMPSLADFFETPEDLSRTFLTTIPNHELVEALLRTTRNIVGDLDDPETGLLLVLPVTEAYGMNKRRNR